MIGPVILASLVTLITACGAEQTSPPVTLPPLERTDEPRPERPMSEHLVGVWRVDIDGTLALKQPGLKGHLREREDLSEDVALAYRPGEVRSIRRSDGAVGPKTAVTLEDRPFGDAWLKIVGQEGTAHVAPDGDGIILNDDETATRLVRVDGLDPRWDEPGIELFPAEDEEIDEIAPLDSEETEVDGG